MRSISLKSSDDNRPTSLRVVALTSGLLVFSLVADLCLRVPAGVLIAEFLFLVAVALACLAWQRFDRLWPLTFALAWLSIFVAFYSMGGALSPFFSAQLILLLFTGACAFKEASPLRICGFTAANGFFWILISLVSRDAVVSLPRLFIIKHNAVLMICGMACLTDFLTRWQNQKFFSERQAKRLLELESQLIHADKMAEIGKLVATTAHELAQPAQVILTSSSLLREFVDRGNVGILVLSPLSERLIAASERISKLLVHLKNFSRKEGYVAKSKVDIREPISSVSVLLDYDLRSRGIRFDMVMPQEPSWISGDAHRLQQVILNLVNNARDASASAPRPAVSVRCESFAYGVRVMVENNGKAIPLDVQGRLFEPYFTTKARGEGTGLGLLICHQLIEEHEGRILFSSHDDKTIFVIDIPLMQETQAEYSGAIAKNSSKRPSFQHPGSEASH